MNTKIGKLKAHSKLLALVAEGESIRASGDSSDAFSQWFNASKAALRNIFGEKSLQSSAFAQVSYSPIVTFMGEDNSAAFAQSFRSGMGSAISQLQAYAGEVEEFWPDEVDNKTPIAATRAGDRRTVFIIHGHELDFAEVVARFVEKRGLNAVILHEKPNQGRTIIEKFETHAAPCVFAIAIFTGDDVGGVVGEDKQQPRARQNVILETGYFIGALNRKHVVILHESNVELPSDFGGLLYIPTNADWRSKLGQELDAAGIGTAQ